VRDSARAAGGLARGLPRTAVGANRAPVALKHPGADHAGPLELHVRVPLGLEGGAPGGDISKHEHAAIAVRRGSGLETHGASGQVYVVRMTDNDAGTAIHGPDCDTAPTAIRFGG
jgi:hypothetical protein